MTSPERAAADDTTAEDDRALAEVSWPEAGAAAFEKFTDELDRRAKQILDSGDGDPDPDPIHDMRVATRRLRTAATIYRSAFPNAELGRLEDELRRVAHRLGATRDLDVLLEMLEKSGSDGGPPGDGLKPLRRAWKRERRREARRLRSELGRRRFDRALQRSKRLALEARSSVQVAGRGDADNHEPIQRVAHRAPSTIWKSFGAVLAYDLEPMTADPADIHEMRIAAKGFRYTLEAFEHAVEPALTALIDQVTALQDAAGEMHDAIVAAERARAVCGDNGLDPPEREAIERFAAEQDTRAEDLRADIGRRLAAVQGQVFRRWIGDAVVALAGKGVHRAGR